MYSKKGGEEEGCERKKDKAKHNVYRTTNRQTVRQ